MHTAPDYVYYSCSKSSCDKVWDGEMKQFLVEKSMMSELLRYSIGMDVLPAFAPGHHEFRLIASGAQMLPNLDSRTYSGSGIPELYGDLAYVADHLDAVWPGDDDHIGAAPSALGVLHQVNYWWLLGILDKIADSRTSRACRWVFHFEDEDHILVLPPSKLIRAHRDSHSPPDSTSATGTDDSNSEVDDSYDFKPNGPSTDDQPRSTSYRMTFRVAEVLGPDEFRADGGQLIKIAPQDLKGRKVGDELVVYLPSQPKTVIDLTGPDVRTQWQSQLNLGGSGDLRNGSLP